MVSPSRFVQVTGKFQLAVDQGEKGSLVPSRHWMLNACSGKPHTKDPRKEPYVQLISSRNSVILDRTTS